MQESALGRGHGLEPETLLVGRGGEDAELTLLSLCPVDVLLENLESFVRVGDVVVRVGVVDLEGIGQLAIPLQSETFVVAFQRRLPCRRGVQHRGHATHFLLAILAWASDERLGLARLVLLARIWSVTLLGASVFARLAYFAASLGAV